MKKKIMVTFVAAICSVSLLVGCGGRATSTTTTTRTNADGTTTTTTSTTTRNADGSTTTTTTTETRPTWDAVGYTGDDLSTYYRAYTEGYAGGYEWGAADYNAGRYYDDTYQYGYYNSNDIPYNDGYLYGYMYGYYDAYYGYQYNDTYPY